MMITGEKEEANILVEIVFCLYIKLGDYDTAIEYFKKNIQESTKEIELYVLLEKLFIFDLNDYFIREYEAGERRGLNPEKSCRKFINIQLKMGSCHSTFGEVKCVLF